MTTNDKTDGSKRRPNTTTSEQNQGYHISNIYLYQPNKDLRLYQDYTLLIPILISMHTHFILAQK